MQSWLNALLLKTDATTDKPTGAQIAVVYGALGLVVSKLLS